MATIGEQIRTARKAKGMTQDDLASVLNVTRSGISKWETNDRVPDAEMLLRLSEALNYQFALSSEENASEESAADGASGKEKEKQESAALPETDPAGENDPADSPEPASLKDRFIRYLPICAAVLALVILAVVLIHANQPKKTADSADGNKNGYVAEETETAAPTNPSEQAAEFVDGNGNRFTIEEFKVVTPNDPTKAYLSFQSSLKFTGEGLDKHIFYTFDMREENGIALHIDRFDLVTFSINGKFIQDTITAKDLIDWEEDPEIKANGSFPIMGGTDYYTSEGKADSVGVGVKVYCTDAGNNPLVFQSFVYFPQE